MLVNLEQIKVTDRIRKDFGDIQELADDIKENGLINPPVVTPDTYELIAGERRLKAMKLLGYRQIEVRPMSVKDAEHQLNLEISENETRKDFSKKERIDYARRLERIEKVKAQERSGTRTDLKENFPTGEEGQVRDIVASKLGIGSGKQYEKEKYIADNANPILLSQWDKGDISTHAAYVKLKKEKDELEKKVKQLESHKLEVVEKIIDNTDYSSIEKKTKELQQLQNKYNIQSDKISILNDRVSIFESNSDKYKKLTSEIDKLTKEKSDIARRIVAVTSISGLTEKIDFMLKNELAPIKYSQALQEASGDEIVAKNLSNIIYSVQRWCDEMKTYLPNDDKNNVIDMEEI